MTGIVFDLKARGPGYTAQASAPVLKIVPQGKLEASVDVESSKIGFVKTGMPVELSIDSYPANDFGTLKGTVGLISSDALPPDRSKGQASYLFPTKVILSSQRLPQERRELALASGHVSECQHPATPGHLFTAPARELPR